MNSYLQLKPFPDVPSALQALKNDGLRLAFLANLKPACTRNTFGRKNPYRALVLEVGAIQS
jgi:phosphoglycolate phosphatase-like HAD superfamily hydrolase